MSYFEDDSVTLHHGDAVAVLRDLPDGSAHCVVTSPPYYGLRDYGTPGQYGLESSPSEYVETMRSVFAEVRRVLAADGTLWLNLGDSYSRGGGQGHAGGNLQGGGRPSFRRDGAPTAPAGRRGNLPGKSLLGMPWRVAFELQDDGWILRNAIVWDKPNAMPESVTDRLSCTYETVFLFSRSPRYWFDLDAIREPLARGDALNGKHPIGGTSKSGAAGRMGASARRAGGDPSRSRYGATGLTEQVNMGPSGKHHGNRGQVIGRNPGDVWPICTQPFPDAHFAVMAQDLASRCVLAGAKPGGTVLDPFCGSGTTGMVALKHGRRFVGIDLSAAYLDLALRTRLNQTALVDSEPERTETAP